MDKPNSQQQLVPGSGASRGELVRVYGSEEAEVYRAEIDAARRQIADSLALLQSNVEQTVTEMTDWRGWVDEHTMAAVGIAFAVGLYLGLR